MKGRGTRKCPDTGKDIYKLVDFVDLTRLEAAITNETPGIEDEPIEQEEEEIINRERGEGVKGEAERPAEIGSEQEMVIADVPVHLVFSETISPQVLEQFRCQVEAQLKTAVNAKASNSASPRPSSVGATSRVTAPRLRLPLDPRIRSSFPARSLRRA